ncbi:hypothetical protein [Nonomuraea diastatica]|uniref:Uncharacterized protein n=1 Tax=Nonomuraea diastatica TaxID=1848329 RepID=A0A4R4WWW3_9ACTN|nr:hypothetical protein [Nonomuraea diastatica]TDD22256.1 hypothetical protein E1294_12430 [Nonomuraea diastatica]
MLTVIAALAVLVLFMALVWGIRAEDRTRQPHTGPRTEIEQLTRRLLLYASSRDRPGGSAPTSSPDRERWR